MKKKQISSEDGSGNSMGTRILNWALFLMVVASAISLPLLLSGNRRELATNLRTKYIVGSLAQEDVIARDTLFYVDEQKTKSLQQTAAKAVLPRFTFSMNRSQEMLNLVDSIFGVFLTYDADLENAMKAISSILAEHGLVDRQGLFPSIAAISSHERISMHAIIRETLGRLLASGIYDQAELELIGKQGYTKLNLTNSISQVRLETPQTKDVSTVLTPGKLERTLFGWFKNYGTILSVNQNVQIIDIIALVLKPNVLYDELETAVMRKKAADAIEPETIRVDSGQYILKKDYVITEQDIVTLQALMVASLQYTFLEQVGRVCFVLIVTLCAVYAMKLVFIHSHRRDLFIALFLGGTLLTQIALFFILQQFSARDLPTLDPFLPVLVLPIFMSLITNHKRAGMIAAITLGSYAILLPAATVSTVFFVVAECFCGIYFIRFVSRRIDMLFQWFFGAVASCFLVVLNNLLMGFSFHGLLPLITAMVLNVSFTYVLVTVLLPLAELFFNIPTTFRLRELAYSDSPVLLKLSRSAQGTYNHSQAVADLAYAAASAVGADPLLARVGAIHHDIGKLDHPEYFIENQSGDNKHDDLKTSLSVAIIKSHVKIGVEKGREAGLPQEVLDIISQHHGNDVIPFFLKEAQEVAANSKNPSKVKIEDFSYNNSPPQTPEAAIVMLADGVEAASRAMQKPSIQKFEKLVNQVIMGKIERKQLYLSRLSLTDLDVIAASFIQTLVGRSHRRLENPEIVEEEK
jgi:hypothetical protein